MARIGDQGDFRWSRLYRPGYRRIQWTESASGLAGLERKPVESKKLVLDVKHLEAHAADGEPAPQGVCFSIREGEILGFAGISGNGQSELAEVITGMRRATKGQVIIDGKDYTNHAPRDIIRAAVAHIPEKRRAMGVIEPMTAAENVVMKDIRVPPFSLYLKI